MGGSAPGRSNEVYTIDRELPEDNIEENISLPNSPITEDYVEPEECSYCEDLREGIIGSGETTHHESCSLRDLHPLPKRGHYGLLYPFIQDTFRDSKSQLLKSVIKCSNIRRYLAIINFLHRSSEEYPLVGCNARIR